MAQSDNNSENNINPVAPTKPQLSEETELKVRLEEYLNGWKRAKADLINFKKDNEKRIGEMAQFAHTAVLSELLPLYDQLDRSFQFLPETLSETDWVKGIRQIHRQWSDLLKKFGIEKMKTVGEKFDPTRHESLEIIDGTGADSEIIVSEMAGGYTWHGRTLIPAKVKIAK